MTFNLGGSSDPELESYSYLLDVGEGFFAKTFDDSMANVEVNFMNYYYRFDEEEFSDFNETPISYRSANDPRVYDKFWLSLSKDNKRIGNALIGFSDVTTDGFDRRYDSKTFNNETSVGIYSKINDQDYLIQTLNTYNNGKKIRLSYMVQNEGFYTMNLSKIEGNLSNENIYLRDKLTNQYINLKENINYEFFSDQGYNDTRFEIVFQNDLSSSELEYQKLFEIHTDKNNIILTSKSNKTNEFEVYTIEGKLIYKDKFLTKKIISNVSKGIYVIKVKNEEKQITQKLIVK